MELKTANGSLANDGRASETCLPNQDFYQKIRKQIHRWLLGKGKNYEYAELLLIAPDLLHLLCRLSIDARVPYIQKGKLLGAILYFISPVDLMSEAVLGAVGFIDDIPLAALVLNSFVNAGHGYIAEEYWAGEENILLVIQKILRIADNMLGSGTWGRVKRVFQKM